ncbi:MAG: hypothetical protein ACE5KS_05590 [Woeseiaceae bacterium]
MNIGHYLMPFIACLDIGAVPGASVGANYYAALFEEAVEAIDGDYVREWAYTETSADSESTTIGRFDPTLPEGERWTLVSIDDREPTATEIAEFAALKSDHDGDDSSDAGDMVEPDSLTLIEETVDYWLFSFIPAEDEDDEGFFVSVDATLKIIKDGPYLEYIDMRNNKPFKPRAGVRVKEFLTRLRFGPAAPDGPVVPLSIDVKINARAFLLIGINEAVTIRYSDYEHVGEGT